MKKIIKKETDSGIVQITIADERWYCREQEGIDVETVFVPSVTWITSFYPKGIAFHKWLASKGWDESEAIKIAAGNKGSKVHLALADLIDGKQVAMDGKYPNRDGVEEELTLEEYDAIMSFVAWFKKVNPVPLSREIAVFNDQDGYAGTVDFICTINDEVWVIDFKTSQNLWPEHELQISAYKHAIKDSKDFKLGILQLGYNRNKAKFKFNPIEDKFSLFLAAKMIWAEECSKIEPLKRNYPMVLSLTEKED